MMLGDQADGLDRLGIAKTPENFDYIATKLEPAMQQAFVKAFRQEFPEIPVSDIPLPQVHPAVVAWAKDAKQELLSAPPSPSAPLRQEPVAADDAEITAKPPVRIGYSLLNIGRRGLNAILKRKPAAPLVAQAPPAAEPVVESPAVPAAMLTHETPGETLKPNPESVLPGLSHLEKVEAQKAVDPQAERYRS